MSPALQVGAYVLITKGRYRGEIGTLESAGEICVVRIDREGEDGLESDVRVRAAHLVLS